MSSSNSTPASPQMPPQAKMMQMVTGCWLSQCIYVAAKLNLADLLKDGSRSCDNLAEATGTNSNSLYRLLRALASVDIFAETEPGHFQLTPLAATLQSDSSNSLKSFALLIGGEGYQMWGELPYSVETGKEAYTKQRGMPLFAYYQENPQAAAIFNQAMTNLSALEQAAVVEAYDFTGINKLVDVAGGCGSQLATILQAYPQMQGILLDLPKVIAPAEAFLTEKAVSDRTQLVPGNFFEEIPSGGDAYLLKHIIHDWEDPQALTILQRCYQAMPEGGRLLIIEEIIPPDNQPSTTKFWDLTMLIMCGGKERTAQEYQQLLKAANFALNRIVPTKSNVSVIEAVK
ncbi:MAG: methyltransferase [Spirulinaceae cyanobacterium]